MTRTISILLISFVLCLSAFSQTAPQCFGVKTEKGMSVVYNNGNKTFSFEIVGKDIKSADANPTGIFLIVDGKTFQVTFPKVADILGNQKTTDEKLVLKAHQKWEVDFQAESVYKKSIMTSNESTVFLDLAKGKSQQTFFWTYKRPDADDNSDYSADAFQTTLIGDIVLVIGSPYASDEELKERRQYFDQTLSSLIFFDKPITANASAPAAKPKTAKKPKRKN